MSEVTPSPSTKKCDELRRPGSWDLGPPRVVNTLARSLLVPQAVLLLVLVAMTTSPLPDPNSELPPDCRRPIVQLTIEGSPD